MTLEGKVGIITGIANRHSIAAGCARVMHAQGAKLIVTYLNEKAKRFVDPVAEEVGAEDLLPLDVTEDDQMAALFAAAEARWGRLDFALHSIAFCPKYDLHAEVVDCSREGFLHAMDVSCHSFLRMAKAAVPLMKDGGSLMTVSYHGAEQVIDHYNIMGPVKAALESSVRYLAADLGERGVRVNALSPGPIATRAASGIDHFDVLMEDAVSRSPDHQLTTIEEVGEVAAFLASDAAGGINGGVHYVDRGLNIIGSGPATPSDPRPA